MKITDYMLDAALKAGWIQIGPSIPVFFKLDPIGENVMVDINGNNPLDYCCRFVTTCDYNAYYDLYNKWINEGNMRIEDLDINRIFGTAYTTLKCTIENLSYISNLTISDYYYYMFLSSYNKDEVKRKYYKEKQIYYENIAKTLKDVTTSGV